MTIQQYYIQPGDAEIQFDLPLGLDEIKHLYTCVARQHEADSKNGVIVKPTEELLNKLDGLINYLQSENYEKL